MKKKLDWKTKEIVNIFEDVTLWSAPFGRLLLENIPMKPKCTVLDLGFGTGFPLIELSQRFGDDSEIYGMDIWEAAIARTKNKIAVLELDNIKIFEESAVRIPLEENSVDLVTSNLGINNFEEKELVYKAINRVMKKDGRLCITTNPIGTFKALLFLFDEIFVEFNWDKNGLLNYEEQRGTPNGIIAEIEQFGFRQTKMIKDETNFRFSNALAVLNHGLIRIAFLSSLEALIPENKQVVFFKLLQQKIDRIIQKDGCFTMTVPMLYLEFAHTSEPE